jgi:hypothetical protein
MAGLFSLTAVPLSGPARARPNGRASMACRTTRGLAQYGKAVPFTSGTEHREARPNDRRALWRAPAQALPKAGIAVSDTGIYQFFISTAARTGPAVSC